MRCFRFQIMLVSGVYACFVAVWQGLRFTPIGEWWPFELLDIFGLLTFAPLPFLLLLSLLGRSGRSMLWLLVPVTMLAWDYGVVLLPRSPPAGGTPLRVMTANVLVGNAERERISALITLEQPDLVALQELSPPMAGHLDGTLRSAYPYQLAVPSEVPDGLGILSRYPIHVEPETGWHSHVCGCQRATITVGERTLTFVNVHPPPPAVGYARLGRAPVPVRFDRSQTASVLEAALDGIDPRNGPLIVAGDLNVGDRQPLYRRVRGELLDAHHEAGWGLGYTFPALSFEGFTAVSLVRIDYVLHSSALATRAVHTGIAPGSDHRYVVADLLLR